MPSHLSTSNDLRVTPLAIEFFQFILEWGVSLEWGGLLKTSIGWFGIVSY